MEAMSKRQLIDEILSLNRSAHPGFLAEFSEPDLRAYLAKLVTVVAGGRWQAPVSPPPAEGTYVPDSAPLFESVA